MSVRAGSTTALSNTRSLVKVLPFAALGTLCATQSLSVAPVKGSFALPSMGYTDLLLYLEYFNDERGDFALITMFNQYISPGMQWLGSDRVGEMVGRVGYDLDARAQCWILNYQWRITSGAVFEAMFRLPYKERVCTHCYNLL